MNTTQSESITADIFMEFEEDASAFANAEPESVPSQAVPAPTIVEQLKVQLAALTPPERAELAHFLIHSLDQTEEGVEAAWEAEIAHRLEEIESGKVIGEPAAQVLDELRKKYSG